MNDELETKLRSLRRAFTAKQMDTRPEVWCALCEAGDPCPHPKGVCKTCGEHMTAAHNHIPYVPIEELKKRFNEIDPTWQWTPVENQFGGVRAPEIVGHGRFEFVWGKLTILGVTHIGVGQQTAGDRRFGPAGLKSLAIANAALDFGIGLQARQSAREARKVELQELEQHTWTNPNMPDLPEGGGEHRLSHEAMTAASALTLKDVRGWFDAHHKGADVKIEGRMVGPNLLRMSQYFGVSPTDIRDAVMADRPLDPPNDVDEEE